VAASVVDAQRKVRRAVSFMVVEIRSGWLGGCVIVIIITVVI